MYELPDKEFRVSIFIGNSMKFKINQEKNSTNRFKVNTIKGNKEGH